MIMSCIWNAIDSINETHKFDFPADPASLVRLETGFRSKSRSQVLKGCLGAIDGVHFPMMNPGNTIDNPQQCFVQRKGKFALLHLACCDSDRKFTFFDCSKSAKTHDSLAFYGTKVSFTYATQNVLYFFYLNKLTSLKLHELICKSDKLPLWSYFLGDNAFPASYHMLVPDPNVANYDNFEQSSNRMHIECAFGMLVNKWPILWRKIDVKFERRVPLINACFHLHNFCIDRRMMKEDTLTTQDEYAKAQPSLRSVGAVWCKKPIFDKKGRPVEYLNWTRENSKVSEQDGVRDKFFHREKLCNRIVKKGLCRPQKRKRS